MSEYWVSKKKYFCQYCEIYIADDVPSRTQHENGLRHKGNKDRFIRGLYKSSIKKKQESEEEKLEMKRVEQAAQAAYARDIGAGHATASGPSSSSAPAVPTPKPKPPLPKPSNPYTNYTTAASLGITDPDVDRLVAEAQLRKSEGRAGDWVAVVPPPPPLPQDDDPQLPPNQAEPEPSVGEIRKREEVPIDENDTRRFKIQKKTVAVGLGEIYDPGVIRVKPRVDPKPETKVEPDSKPLIQPQGPALGGDIFLVDTKAQAAPPVPDATEKPAWTSRGWKRAGEIQETNDSLTQSQSANLASDELPESRSPQGLSTLETGTDVKHEEDVAKPSLDTDIGLQSGSSSGGSLFRKRKAPAGGSSTRGGRRRDA